MFIRKITKFLSKLIIKPVIGKILGRFSAISFFFFICYKNKKDKQDKILYNHELIHFYQQVEMLFIFQWLFYGYYYLKFKNKGFSKHKAYMKKKLMLMKII